MNNMNKKIIIVFVTIVLGCTQLLAVDYVSLTPLDRKALPEISNRSVGRELVCFALTNDLIWDKNKSILVKENFSIKTVMDVLSSLSKTTEQHVESFSCKYWSKTPQGDSLLVSGNIYLPRKRKLNGIIIANHYTIAKNAEAPSNAYQMECIYALKGYAVIMPDYVGYGITRDRVHPYLHWRNAAQTAVDLLDCMPELLDHYGYIYPKDVVITGYSQGGAVALGVARLLEERAMYGDGNEPQWTIRKLYAGAGPYNPAATYDYCVKNDMIGYPAVLPLIVMGMNEAYGLKFQLKDFFYEPLLSNYDNWIASKEYTLEQISTMMGSSYLSDLMLQQALDRRCPMANLLYTALLMNNNVGYNLQAPAYFLHSLDDEVVPVINTIAVRDNMPNNPNVVYDLGHYGSHIEGALIFVKNVFQDLIH
jgi:pimeloyl-ACP methyl ester carboxylesterase